MKWLLIFTAIFSFSYHVTAQDTLPKFSVTNVGEYKVRISWTNPFGDRLTQLNVQRSFDSLINYRTIFLSPSPALPQNGFIDAQAYGTPIYYKIFYVLDGADYHFTIAQQPKTNQPVRPVIIEPSIDFSENKMVSIYFNDSLLTKLPMPAYLQFKDSIALKTKDTLYAISADAVIIKPFKAKETWKPSSYIYTNRRGYVDINLPEAKSKHYHLKIMNESGEVLYDIKHVKEIFLTLDKSNFMHAGWYFFELYEEGKVKEKNKFYLWKDF